MFKIGDFSKLSMVSIRMLHYYDNLGLLVPIRIDDQSGYRYYSASQLTLAQRIVSLRDMGFSTAGIKKILEENDSPKQLLAYLQIQHAQLREQEEKLKSQLHLLQSTMARLRKDEQTMEYTVTVKELPAQNVMCLRRVIESYPREHDLWEQLHKEAAPQRVQMTTPNYCLSVYYDEDYREKDVDVEVRAAVVGTYRDTQNLKFKTTPPVTVASTIFKGDFINISSACAAIGTWISDNRYEMAGPMLIIYHTNPDKEQNPENFVTEVCFPIKKAI